MPDGNLRVRLTPISITSSPSSHATVNNAGPELVYYKRESNVSGTSNEGSLAAGESLTFSNGPRWFISVGKGSRLFATYSPEATTDMATQAELDAVSLNVMSPVYGAKGDGSTDDSTAIQAAINAASAAGGGTVFLPVGTFIVGTTLKIKSKVVLRGVSPSLSILKLKNSAAKETGVLTVENQGAGGQDYYEIRNLAVNGNKANNAEGSFGIWSDGRRVRIDNVWVYNTKDVGLVTAQSASDFSNAEGGCATFVSNFLVYNGDDNGIENSQHDAQYSEGFCIANKVSNFKTSSITAITSVHVYGAAEYGFDMSGKFEAVNCQAEGASKAQVRLNVDGGSWSGGRVFISGTPENVPGFLFESTKGNTTLISDVAAEKLGTPGLLKFTGTGSGSTITGTLADEKATPVWTGEPGATVDFSRVRVRGTATNPIRTKAAANTLELPLAPVVEITGNTEIKKITAPTTVPYIVTLIFAGTPTVKDGENLNLAGDFTAEGTTNGKDTMLLAFDGTNYNLVGSSKN